MLSRRGPGPSAWGLGRLTPLSVGQLDPVVSCCLYQIDQSSRRRSNTRRGDSGRQSYLLMRLRRSVKAEIGGSRNLEQKIADVRSKKLVDQNARTRRRTSCQIGGLKSTSIPFSFAASDRHDRPRLSWRPSSSSCGGPQQASGLHRAGHFVPCREINSSSD